MTISDIDNRFSYHAPDAEQVLIYEDIRSRAKDLALYLNDLLPNSREKSLAITVLEECVFWSNASVARNIKLIGDK